MKRRWDLFAKGGGAKRWSGFDQSVVDRQFDGIRLKSYQEDTPGAIHWKGRMPDSSYFFKSGWTFSRIARGNLALREMPEGSLFGHTSPAAIPFIADNFFRIGFWLNTRIFSFLLRSVNQSVDCQEGYVYIGVLRSGFETELRTLEREANPTALQQGRKLLLEQWVEELKAFGQRLELVLLAAGFGPEALRPALRQFAIDDAVLSLTACWLRRLEREVGGQRSAAFKALLDP